MTGGASRSRGTKANWIPVLLLLTRLAHHAAHAVSPGDDGTPRRPCLGCVSTLVKSDKELLQVKGALPFKKVTRRVVSIPPASATRQ